MKSSLAVQIQAVIDGVRSSVATVRKSMFSGHQAFYGSSYDTTFYLTPSPDAISEGRRLYVDKTLYKVATVLLSFVPLR